jgi:hypothetical protein
MFLLEGSIDGHNTTTYNCNGEKDEGETNERSRPVYDPEG